ncbi:hypothetical protein [Pseudomonas sp. NPDC089569]|uniref:hypothetical protein n=1 Tax=Pseudomonas sp. NPDC089569 TaxID=3390722 RepID=UPI003CFFB0F5
MKESTWNVLKTQNRDLPTVHGFVDENGYLIIQNDSAGLAIFTREMVGMADSLRGADLLHVTEPQEYSGSWRCVGRDTLRGDANTPYPLMFARISSDLADSTPPLNS